MSLSFFDHAGPRLDEVLQPGMLCAFDFDGTLAPIVKDPQRACMPAAVLRRLIVLSEHARVAIVTGRSVEDICTRLDFLPDYVVGNHGIEGVPGWEGRAESYRQLCQRWEQDLTAALQDHANFEQGIWVENKTYSLSVHYRMARERTQAEDRLVQLFATRMPDAHVMKGKCVFNLLPPEAPNKGSALVHLLNISGAPSVLYVGDDVTDEDVFRLRRDDVLTVRVERAADSAAEFFLHHRLDMVQLLDVLIERLRGKAASGMRDGV